MPQENMNQQFRLKKIISLIEENYLIEEINQNELMSNIILNYIEHSLFVISTITGCVSISLFVSLVGISIGITSCAIGLKLSVITAELKNYKSIIMKRKNKHGKIVLLLQSKLNRIYVLISNALIDSNTSHDEFILINNVLKELYMKEEMKNSNNK